MRRRAWKWALGVFGGVALVFGLIAWDAHRRADEVFAQHALEVAAKIAAIFARPAARAPLFGDPIPGNGWEIYTKALDVLGELPQADADEITELRADVTGFTPDPAKLEALLAKYSPQIEELRRLARSAEFVPDYAYEEGAGMLLPYVAKTIRAAKFLAGMAGHLHETGRDREALELLILGLAMSHDTGRRGPLVNHLVLMVGEGIVAEKWNLVLGGHGLTAADLERFAGLLDRLAASRPLIAEIWDVEDAFVRKTLLDDDAPSRGLRLRPSWRHLFSARLMRAEALNGAARVYAEISPVDQLPPWERPPEAGRRLKELERSDSRLVQWFLPAAGRVYEREAAALATWALMRAATAIAWHEAEMGAPPARLEDLVPRYLPKLAVCPYTGKPFGYAAGKLWSFSGDGDDDGGAVAAEDFDDTGTTDGDIIWAVKRRP